MNLRPRRVSDVPRILLRLEGLCALIVACLIYAKLGMSWGNFGLYFLAPDLALLAYLAGPKVGAIFYNSTHSYIGALLCCALGLVYGQIPALAAGLIWVAHIGFDRALGYGLKYAIGFGHTHLGMIGRDAHPASNTHKN